MTLEATMLILDNSDWMRNGDYTPSRFEAQADAVNTIFQVKTRAHPENTVGIMTMAGKGPEVLTTFTGDIGKILNALHKTTISGTINLSSAIQVAQLALKHRRNRNQRQRVIAFVGSPLTEDEASLVRLAKKLKKNNIAVDIISFGEDIENRGKLESFINNINSGDNSHLVSIPPGPHLLSDMLISSPIISSGEGGGLGGFDFGVDAEMDPELALALRLSLEEEQARQAAAAAAAAAAASEGGNNATTETSVPATSVAPEVTMIDEGMTEEEQIARAIEMSLQESRANNTSESSGNFVSGVLSGLPGVDTSDPRVQDVLSKSKEDDANKKDDKSQNGSSS